LLQIPLLIVNGAAAGFAGTLFMTFFEIPFWSFWGWGGVAEWQVNSVIVSMMLRKSASVEASVAMHLLHGTILGGIFALFVFYIPGATQFSFLLERAILFSLILLIVSPFGTRKFFESKGKLQMTRQGLVVSFFSHVIYGFALGAILYVLII
jgi:hypothetical protein